MDQGSLFNEVLLSAQAKGAVSYDVNHRNAYSNLLASSCRDAITKMVADDQSLGENLQSAFVMGAVALGCAVPYKSLVAGRRLPEKTLSFWRLIYTWLFVFAGKKIEKVAETRFLAADLSSSVDLTLWFYALETMDQKYFKDMLVAEFRAIAGFVPEINITFCTVEQQQISALLTGICIIGVAKIDSILKREIGDIEEYQDLPIFQDAANKIAEDSFSLYSQRENGDQIIDLFHQAHHAQDTSICVDWLSADVKSASTWHRRNAEFFSHIRSGQYHLIHIEDITKRLHDGRNLEKENAFTIVKVTGLEANGRFIPAEKVVLKLRGYKYFRGDLNNYIDLLKEYMSYVTLSDRMKTSKDYLLQAGPLLLTCEKLDLPLDLHDKETLLGIFLEEIPYDQSQKVITSRVKYLTDFWILNRVMDQIRQVSHGLDLPIKRNALCKEIRNLVGELLKNNLRIDYCDMAVFLRPDGSVNALKLFDFERASFQELTSENHPVLDMFIDLKRVLKKEYWEDLLIEQYQPVHGGGISEFNDFQKYIYPKSKKRERMFSFLWKIRDTIFLAGEVVGDSLWNIFFLGFVTGSCGLFDVLGKFMRRYRGKRAKALGIL